MISYRHVQKDWNRFLVPARSKRVTSMCGRKVAAKYVGTPGIDAQPFIVGGRPGWCLGCMHALLKWYRETYKLITVRPAIEDVYNLVFSEMFSFMEYSVENDFPFSQKSE